LFFISDLTNYLPRFSFSDEYPRMFTMLWKRLQDYAQIRHVQKALFVIEFCLRHGADRFVADVRDRADSIGKLRSYRYIEDEREIGGDGMSRLFLYPRWLALF
jgi:hypothetical protein